MASNETTIMLSNVRLAFPHLFTPSKTDFNGLYRRGALFIIRGDDAANLAVVNAAIERAAERKWPDVKKREAILALLHRQDKVCLHEGITKAKYDGFEGNWFLSANAKSAETIEGAGPVTVVDRDRTIALTEAHGRPYSGCYVNALVEIYAQDSPSYGQRINAVLKGVQFWADGDAFAGTPPARPEEFSALEESSSAEDFV